MYPMLQSRDDILRMLDEITEARKQILERCAGLTAAQLNDPVYPDTWSVLQNLAHLAWAEEWMLLWVRKRPGTVAPQEAASVGAWPGVAEAPLDLGPIRTALDEAHAATIAFLKANPESVLTERCHFSRKGEQTVGGVFFHLIEHEIHHRAFILHKLAKLGAR